MYVGGTRAAAVLAGAALLLAGCTGAASLGRFTGTWLDAAGVPAERGQGQDRTFEVSSSTGPEHCEWQSAVFLHVGWPLGTHPDTSADLRQYLRDPQSVIGRPQLLGQLDLDSELPEGSRPTGYRTGAVELWFGPDGGDRYAYLRTGQSVERWPRAAEAVACA